jgi:hypothetical protein
MKPEREKQLKSLTKKEVFEIYVRQCLGRVHNAKCGEQNKGWMIEDILRTEFRSTK